MKNKKDLILNWLKSFLDKDITKRPKAIPKNNNPYIIKFCDKFNTVVTNITYIENLHK